MFSMYHKEIKNSLPTTETIFRRCFILKEDVKGELKFKITINTTTISLNQKT